MKHHIGPRASITSPSYWLFFVCVISCFMTGHDCLAGQGNSFTLPMNKRVRNGIVAEVNTRWVDGFGHRPLRIRFGVRKANRDRTITVRVYPASYNRGHQPLQVEATVEIPQGEKEVFATIPIPQQEFLYWMRLEFFEDGKKLKDLSMDQGHSFTQNSYNNGDQPCAIIVDSAAPSLYEDRDRLVNELRIKARKAKGEKPKYPNVETISFLGINHAHHMNNQDVSDSFRDVDSLNIVQSTPNLEMLPPSELPESLVAMGSVDLVIISLTELQNLKQEFPAKFAAVDQSIRNGANLIVYGGADVQSETSDLFQQSHAWRQSRVDDFFQSPNRAQYYEEDDDGSVRIKTNRRLKSLLGSQPNFFVGHHGFGRIVASEAEDLFQRPSVYWEWMTQAIGSTRLTWLERHGIQLNSDNADFWDFLIPGYGATPVVSFLSVIGLFVLAIGPINFFVLKRMKRFYLLPLTVALAALITTGVMLTYSFLSDGIESRVRLRSFTHLNERSDKIQVASTQCRHAYLATVTPRDGLVVPDRMLVYPIEAVHRYQARRRQRITSNGKRMLHHGYIGSRSTSQFLTTDVQPTEDRLLISESSDGPLEVINQLGVPIQHAWVTDSKGKVFYAEACGVGESLALQPMTQKDARKQLNDILVDHRPEPPEELNATNQTGYGLGYFAIKAYSQTSLMERDMKECSQNLLRGTANIYVVITEDAPSFVERGMEAKQEAGFHVVRGTWLP